MEVEEGEGEGEGAAIDGERNERMFACYVQGYIYNEVVVSFSW